MKDKLKPNMYVRTKNGFIAKYIGYITDEDIEYNKYLFDGKIYWYYEYYNDYVYEEDFKEWFEEKVIKTSYNIIDLIEENDFINGLRVEKNKYGELYTSYVYYGGGIGKQCEVYTTWLKEYTEDTIENIVTKEQFEAMTYKVSN